ncbi:MAG TPA: hypothetical protein PK661_00515 [Syntrophorhabdaceae bacterium]|mgnify:FL=1|jgi:hypothetical protein|nr:hypothetical protein [Pseudomonadota bacterium]HNQ62537.1 hypothetical protein [Syntrophorhabdaceae bacterium]HOS58552.1 hypothetical protein [Syntrophorhabdaceae bacterium]HQG50862.1 hypothetical protein [Syntrophorhabdaceae bacterium]HQI56476.1 hypothetical protein [Syntrophorhabdaceae bacterium]
MAKRGDGFKSEKRKKELLRLKKQEEKRQRRIAGNPKKIDETILEPTEKTETSETNAVIY